MKDITREDVRQILIDFGGLPASARLEFLAAMNEYLFASPQRRRLILNAWKTKGEAPDDVAGPVSPGIA